MKEKYLIYISIFLLIAFVGSLAYGFNLYQTKQTLNDEITQRESEYNKKIEANSLKFREQEEVIALLEVALEEEKNAYDDLNDDFKDLERQISKINKSVGTLEKLQYTDPELLAKYSKVYFLNEHYEPENISAINDDYLINKNVVITVSSQITDFLDDLMDEAEDDDMDLKILSGYRSYEKQKALKQTYINTYGQEAADTFSADQGHSEHQLGTTVDFTTSALGGNLSAFDTTEEYGWLQDNAYKFGFVLSYPENNEFYKFEPWHWRFVGKDLARDLHRDEKFLYDLPQRELDEYLADIFDK